MAENILDFVNDIPVQDIGYQSADEVLEYCYRLIAEEIY
jgi:hypothetical protein